MTSWHPLGPVYNDRDIAEKDMQQRAHWAKRFATGMLYELRAI